MKHYLKTLFFAILIFPVSNVEAVVIIQYHHVDDKTPPTTSVTPDQFAQHMAYLYENGISVKPLPQIIRSLKNGTSLSDKTLAITFDDGYISVLHSALPILKRYGFPFTVFVNSDLVGGKPFMNWEQLRELTLHGGTIANHTASHPHLIRFQKGETEQQWEERIRKQIVIIENSIERHIGDSPKLFAYPYGEYDTRVKDIIRDLNITAFAQHSGAFDHNVDWQAVPRFAFGGHYADIGGFIEKVNSLPLDIEEVIIKDRHGRILEDPLLPADITRPTLILKLKSSTLAQQIQCFASTLGRIDIKINKNRVVTDLKKDLPTGRSRINCTAPSSQKGRFYWYSQLFIRKLENGNWYVE